MRSPAPMKRTQPRTHCHVHSIPTIRGSKMPTGAHNAARFAANQEAIRGLLSAYPAITASEIALAVGLKVSTVCKHLQVIRNEWRPSFAIVREAWIRERNGK